MPHVKVDHEVFATSSETRPEDTLQRFEDALAAPVALILGLFGLVNAGVPLGGFGAATWIVLAGLLLGKPIGIFLAVLLGRALGLKLPEGLGLKDVLVLGCAAGIGFTVALFVATIAVEDATDLVAAKMGALLSVVAAPCALLLGRALGVKRVA